MKNEEFITVAPNEACCKDNEMTNNVNSTNNDLFPVVVELTCKIKTPILNCDTVLDSSNLEIKFIYNGEEFNSNEQIINAVRSVCNILSDYEVLEKIIKYLNNKVEESDEEINNYLKVAEDVDKIVFMDDSDIID